MGGRGEQEGSSLMASYSVELDSSDWFSPRQVEERRVMKLREEEAERWKAIMERRRTVIEAQRAEVAKEEEERVRKEEEERMRRYDLHDCRGVSFGGSYVGHSQGSPVGCLGQVAWRWTGGMNLVAGCGLWVVGCGGIGRRRRG